MNYVICINNKGYKSSLEQFKVYRRLPDASTTETNLIRVIDESGEDYLYDVKNFTPITLPTIVRRAMKTVKPSQIKLRARKLSYA